MKFKNIAFTMLASVSLIAGTADKSEANEIVEDHRRLASVNILLIGFAYREDYISREHFDDGLQAITNLHKQCKESPSTCENSSEILTELGETILKRLTPQEIEEAKELAYRESFRESINNLLGY